MVTDADCYAHPRDYALAFSFRDIAAEVTAMQTWIARHARRPVHRVLELACGPAAHMPEWVRRGYAFTGLDLSAPMLQHVANEARAAGVTVRCVRADMAEFTLPEPVDFAYVALGSLYVDSSAALERHFSAVAGALAPGGLYLLDWCVQFAPETLFKVGGETWTMQDGTRHVTATVEMVPTRPVEQLFEERLSLLVDEGGQTRHLTSRATKRAIYPQEFLAMIASRTDFEFVGWWNRWSPEEPIQPETRNIFRPVVVLRRR